MLVQAVVNSLIGMDILSQFYSDTFEHDSQNYMVLLMQSIVEKYLHVRYRAGKNFTLHLKNDLSCKTI